jgi:hypothetical protein
LELNEVTGEFETKRAWLNIAAISSVVPVSETTNLPGKTVITMVTGNEYFSEMAFNDFIPFITTTKVLI